MEIAVAIVALVAFIGFVAYKIVRKVDATRPSGVVGGKPRDPVIVNKK